MAVLDHQEWREKCLRLDAVMWQRAEQTASVLSHQDGRSGASQAEVQKVYDEIRKIHGGHGTYQEYVARVCGRQ